MVRYLVPLGSGQVGGLMSAAGAVDMLVAVLPTLFRSAASENPDIVPVWNFGVSATTP